MRPLLHLTMLLAIAACNDAASVPPPPQLVSSATLPVEATLGLRLADTVQVRLVDGDSLPVSGVEVTWGVVAGGGAALVLNGTTDDDGISRALWTLGADPGANRLRASSVQSGEIDFVVTGAAFRADRIASNGVIGCGLAVRELWCWGPAFSDTHTVRSIYPDGSPAYSPGRYGAGREYYEVAVTTSAAGGEVCALDAAGAAWCTPDPAQPFAAVAGLPAIRNLVSDNRIPGRGGDQNFCGLSRADSTAWCWRRGVAPAQVANSPAFARLWFSAASRPGPYVKYDSQRGCGLMEDSTAACWGLGAPGDSSQYGGWNGVVGVTGGHRFSELAVGDRFTCGLTAGEVWCWGGYPLVDDLVPMRLQGGVELVGASYWVMSVVTIGGELLRRDGESSESPPSDPDPARLLPPATGLEGRSILRFGENPSNCLYVSGGEVFCSDEWSATTADLQSHYEAVPPIAR